jgi:hypothetical protein
MRDREFGQAYSYFQRLTRTYPQEHPAHSVLKNINSYYKYSFVDHIFWDNTRLAAFEVVRDSIAIKNVARAREKNRNKQLVARTLYKVENLFDIYIPELVKYKIFLEF